MILAQRILDCLRSNGPLAEGELPRWFADVERMDLDAEVNRLLRKSAISFAFNKYDLVEQKPNGQHAPFIATATAAPPPTAAEEAAASLKPAKPQTSYCLKCDSTKPVSDFQRSRYGKIWSTCKECLGKAVAAGIAARNSGSLERSEGNPSLTVQSKLGSTASPNENPPSDSPSARGEAQRPRTAGPCRVEGPAANTSTEATAVSPETSHDKEPLAAADSAAGRTINGSSGVESNAPADNAESRVGFPPAASQPNRVMLLQLTAKRRRWVTEIAALQHAVKSADELIIALQALEER